MPNSITAPTQARAGAAFFTDGVCRQQQYSMGLRLSATPLQQHIARCLALARTQGPSHCRTAEQDLGNRNVSADFYGLLAELLVLEGLECDGLEPTDYVLLASTAPTGPDFRLNGLTFNVKCVPPGSGFLCVNEKQRTDPRHRADFLLPVVFTSETCCQVYAPIAYTTVTTWQLRQGHSAYRSVAVASLRPLADWQDLRKGGAR